MSGDLLGYKGSGPDGGGKLQGGMRRLWRQVLLYVDSSATLKEADDGAREGVYREMLTLSALAWYDRQRLSDQDGDGGHGRQGRDAPAYQALVGEAVAGA